jgi:hypothetical protein
MVSEQDDRVNVSPVLIVLEADRVAVHRQLPAAAASQTEIAVTTSPLVPAHEVHDGDEDEFRTPVEAVVNVIAMRVVTDDTLPAPAAPGAPVCRRTWIVVGAVNVVPPDLMTFSHALLRY